MAETGSKSIPGQRKIRRVCPGERSAEQFSGHDSMHVEKEL